MTEERLPSKFAFILHADIAGSTALVQQDEDLAHKRIQDTFRRFRDIIHKYHGQVRELRGDALLAEFERASDAVTAALAFQADQCEFLAQLNDTIQPKVRVGIAMGEVIIADDTLTGAGVVLAQRVEQLTKPGDVSITGAIHEALPPRLPYEQDDLGEQQVKGFDESVRVYTVRLKDDAELPGPSVASKPRKSTVTQFALVASVVILICGGGLLAWMQPWQPDFEPASVERMVFPLPDKPSIAVLPFDNFSGEANDDFIAKGLTEDIITALSKLPQFFVISRTSSFAFKDKSVPVTGIAEELGVRYILEGSVQRSGDQLRVNAQLVDALKGHHLWAENFDGNTEDLFSLQDDLVRRILIELDVKLTAGDNARVGSRGTTNLDAWLLREQGKAELYKFTRESTIRTRQLMQQAHEADPNWSRPVGALAWSYWYEARRGWADDREEWIRKGVGLAEKAIEMDPEDTLGYMQLGNLHQLMGDHERAIELRQKAVEIAPNDFQANWGLGLVLTKAGETERAVEVFKHAERVSPRHPASFIWAFSSVLLYAGHYEEAIEMARRAIKRAPDRTFPRIRLTAAYAALGRTVEAQNEAAEVLRIDPKFTVSKWKDEEVDFKDRAAVDKVASLLIEAGLPENPPLELPDKPSIAVLSFDAYSDESEQKHFANGLTEDLITALSRIPELFVIARTSTQRYKGKEVDVREVAKELGVGYILEGSIQKSGDNMRINAQLVDGTNGNHVWAKKYDRPALDFFAIQDDIVQRILVEMHVKLIVGDHAKVASRGTKNLDAWLLTRQAIAEGFTFTPEGMVRARQLYQEAHEIDPKWSRPLAGIAWTHHEEAKRGWSKSREESIDQGIKLAKQAVEMDPKDPFGYMQLGNLMTLVDEWDQGVALREKAIELAPNDFFALVGLAYMYIGVDEADRALEIYQRARKVSPIVPWWMLASEGMAFHLDGQHEQAIQRVKESMERNPKFSILHARLAAIYAELGRDEEAKKQMDMYLKAKPNATVATTMKTYTFKDKTRAEWYADLMRKAGLPD